MQLFKDILAAEAAFEENWSMQEQYDGLATKARDRKQELLDELIAALNLPKGRIHIATADGKLYLIDNRHTYNYTSLEDITPVKVLHIDAIG